MNLRAERLHVLRALAHEAETALLHDLSLPGTVRHLFSEMEAGDDARRAACVGELAAAYDEHGPALFRCVLEYAYLLHTTHDAENLFRGALDRLEKDLRRHAWLAPALVNELGRHARSPYDATRRMVELILKRGAAVPGLMARVVGNRAADFPLRLLAARRIVERKDTADYPVLLDFLLETSRRQATQEFAVNLHPLAKLFGATGPDGLALAVAAFEERRLGPHAPLILSSFRDDFHAWFFANPPAPSPEWARVVLRAWWKAGRADSRARMLALVVDEWCKLPAVADAVQEQLEKYLREKPKYLAPAGGKLAERVREFVGAGDPEQYQRQTAEDILRAAEAKGRAWGDVAAWQPRSKVDGRAAARAFAQAGPEARRRILGWVETRRKAAFQTAAYEALLDRALFGALPAEDQAALLDSPALPLRVNAGRVEGLLDQGHFTPEVRRKLQAVLDRILREFGRGDEETGELS
jgi:hypothetical protein